MQKEHIYHKYFLLFIQLKVSLISLSYAAPVDKNIGLLKLHKYSINGLLFKSDEDTLKTLHNSLKNLARELKVKRCTQKLNPDQSLNTTLSVQTLFFKIYHFVKIIEIVILLGSF